MPSKRLALVFAILTAGIAPLTKADTYQVKFNLGVVEGWRVAPAAINKWCEKEDPDGVAGRTAAYQAWLMKHDFILHEIKRTFEAIIPGITPLQNPAINPVDLIRAHITTEALKMRFLGKAPEAVNMFCKAYKPNEEPDTLEKVVNALAELKAWQEQNGAVK